MNTARPTALDAAVRTLPPGYFALVMATGIVGAGLDTVGLAAPAAVLTVIAAVGYVVLVVLTVWRLAVWRERVREDFMSARNGFLFYTFVAATCVLGTRLVDVIGPWWALAFLAVGLLGWIVLGYAIPWSVVVEGGAGRSLEGVNGTWFVWPVASQSCAVLAATLEVRIPELAHVLSIIAILFWGIGVVLYGVIGVAVVMRFLMVGISPEELGPPYWISMGAAAISVFAGALIVEMTGTPMASVTQGLIGGASVLFWAFASWLVPALLLIGWWRHIRRRVPLTYDPAYWSMVFPLGMYSVAGMYLGAADRLPIVGAVGAAFLWVAVLAWVVVFIATAMSILRRR
ncbi:tellurite resistance/C4-dicarboxylate transporter family protein [Agromyces bauzanensis]